MLRCESPPVTHILIVLRAEFAICPSIRWIDMTHFINTESMALPLLVTICRQSWTVMESCCQCYYLLLTAQRPSLGSIDLASPLDRPAVYQPPLQLFYKVAGGDQWQCDRCVADNNTTAVMSHLCYKLFTLSSWFVSAKIIKSLHH